MTADVAAAAACLVASALAAVRWLRVAQREHYLPGACTRFAVRWWWGLGFNRVLAIGIVANLLLTIGSPAFAALGAIAIAVGPFGLRLKGTAPGPLHWTQRLRTLAVATATIELAVFAAATLAIGGTTSAPFAAYLVAVLTPAFVDAALAVTEPIQRRRARPWIDKAKARLQAVKPTVVAITGSYGKTSTKGYVRHLVEGSFDVVATPASFNNALGLARAVNESLTPGAQVFVAEMGTYGPGEIAAMCEWATPDIAAITAIGPVHLERMGSEDAIAQAKSEILTYASTVVLNVDDERLARIADAQAQQSKTVIRCASTDTQADADIVVTYEHDDLVVTRHGAELARVAATGDQAPTNVAVAVAIASALGVPDDAIAKRLPTLPTAPNRRAITKGSTGATFIDDTYNANPAGARAALTTLQRLGRDADRVVVVTPGMVELGRRQHDENKAFAQRASEIATDVVVIGATNRKALEAGAHEGRARVVLVDGRAQATAWVRDNTNDGDVVLFENDLPDHFP
jgi:UDP-N-acetylmuramoyl-tripeptide--D-alanyl-D-alanine ligase